MFPKKVSFHIGFCGDKALIKWCLQHGRKMLICLRDKGQGKNNTPPISHRDKDDKEFLNERVSKTDFSAHNHCGVDQLSVLWAFQVHWEF